MCVAVVGRIVRLEGSYITEVEKLGIDLRVFTKPGTEMASKIKNVDALIIFTNKASHKAKREAMNVAMAKNIPVFMHHSCGICTLRDCLNCLKNGAKNAHSA
ncbi:MAG: hypothetical protein A2Z09_04325 [Nitrospirae bacterium RBG_16_43_8]|nr:MAG: hypothetical protein A2Z09_04325 [Nitrospirae bacterium RBG_16_43_8]